MYETFLNCDWNHVSITLNERWSESGWESDWFCVSKPLILQQECLISPNIQKSGSRAWDFVHFSFVRSVKCIHQRKKKINKMVHRLTSFNYVCNASSGEPTDYVLILGCSQCIVWFVIIIIMQLFALRSPFELDIHSSPDSLSVASHERQPNKCYGDRCRRDSSEHN